MKITIAILLFLVLTLSFLLYEKFSENEVTKRDAELRVRHHESRADSAFEYALKTKDSLSIAFTTIRFIQEEKEREHKESVVWQNKFYSEKGRRIGILTDAKYDSSVNALYPR